MKPFSWDKRLGLVSPLQNAAIQSGQTNNPSMDKDEVGDEVGLDASHHTRIFLRGGENLFFLTSSLIGQLTRRGWPSKNLIRRVKESLLDSYRTANECPACIASEQVWQRSDPTALAIPSNAVSNQRLK